MGVGFVSITSYSTNRIENCKPKGIGNFNKTMDYNSATQITLGIHRKWGCKLCKQRNGDCALEHQYDYKLQHKRGCKLLCNTDGIAKSLPLG